MFISTRHIRLGKITAVILLLAASCLAMSAHAKDCLSCGPSKASEGISESTGMIVSGTVGALVASGQVVIQSTESSAEGVTIVVKGSGEAASATIRLSGKVLERAALISGNVIEVTAVSTGYLLVAAGKALAFIPNEIGNALLQHAKVE